MHRHRFGRIVVPAVIALSAGWLVTACRAAELKKAEKVLLVGKDLSAWSGDTGEWKVVGEVKMDRADNRRFVTSPGTGVLVNGPTGRTRNLLSKHEHGDVEAHIEFVVPKGSNSGVYLQGRYESQILDSWGVEQPKYGDCGGIYQRWEKGKGFEGHSPRVNASRPRVSGRRLTASSAPPGSTRRARKRPMRNSSRSCITGSWCMKTWKSRGPREPPLLRTRNRPAP